MKLYKIVRFFKSLMFHVYSGLPKSSNAEILERWEICNSCEYMDKDNSQCKICGCNLSKKKIFMNKLAWADQECPIEKWSSITK